MRPPYEQHGANVAFWALFGLFALGELVTRFRSRVNRGGRREEGWSFFVVVACAAAGIYGAFKLAHWNAASIGTGRWPLFGLGLALMAAGILVRQWAILALGRFFTVDVRVHPNQTVVEGGPYRWVRHPSYSGLVVFFVGLGLALGNWASLAAAVLLPTAGLVLRIRSEERALLAALGEDYRSFAATRRRLFPGVW